MSLLSGLGNLGGIGKLLDPGALVKDVVNGVLPKNMGVVGDLAGAFVDFKMGNPIGAVQHAMEAVHDLPQAGKALQGAAANATNPNSSRPDLEPSPPPLGSRAGRPFDWSELMSAIKALTAALTAHGPATPAAANDSSPTGTAAAGTPGAPGTTANAAAQAGSTATSSANASAAAANEHDEAPAATAGESSHRRAGATSTWVGEPSTPATAATSAAAPAASTQTTPEGPSAGQTITSLSQLQGMSDGAVRDAVINGRISPEVAKDQTAMMAVQQRMNAISEMNNLMTAMMRAVHDMQMAIIQNIRI